MFLTVTATITASAAVLIGFDIWPAPTVLVALGASLLLLALDRIIPAHALQVQQSRTDPRPPRAPG
ncbi:hypothetical protein BH23ACT2_BH23ACT2_02630 [soil metagenome]